MAEKLKRLLRAGSAALLSNRITSEVDVIETARDDKTDSDGDKAPAGADMSGSNAPETDRDSTIAIACASGAVVLVAIVVIGVVLRLRWKRGTPAGAGTDWKGPILVLDSCRVVAKLRQA
eukprot:2365378-Rhodomonas_salina.1